MTPKKPTESIYSGKTSPSGIHPGLKFSSAKPKIWSKTENILSGKNPQWTPKWNKKTPRTKPPRVTNVRMLIMNKHESLLGILNSGW
jgi:hypothetical protein